MAQGSKGLSLRAEQADQMLVQLEPADGKEQNHGTMATSEIKWLVDQLLTEFGCPKGANLDPWKFLVAVDPPCKQFNCLGGLVETVFPLSTTGTPGLSRTPG